MNIRLTQLDGKLPNIALGRLSAFFKSREANVVFRRSVYPAFNEPSYDAVFGSAIFSFTAPSVRNFLAQWPQAIVGGTWDVANPVAIESIPGFAERGLDYALWPNFTASIGFTQRGCRLKCGFCVVPKKEGKAHSVATIAEIWRGPPWPRHLHLLDNDFFGQPREQWQARLEEIRQGRFKACFNQGINTRMITDESAEALASIAYFDDSFTHRRLYTAWDNLGDEQRFFDGVDRLERAGIPAAHLLVYMLVGYDKRETWERILYRYRRMVDRGVVRPYPMVYGDKRRRLPSETGDKRLEMKTLGDFQRWVIGRYSVKVPFHGYERSKRGLDVAGQDDLFREA